MSNPVESSLPRSPKVKPSLERKESKHILQQKQLSMSPHRLPLTEADRERERKNGERMATPTKLALPQSPYSAKQARTERDGKDRDRDRDADGDREMSLKDSMAHSAGQTAGQVQPAKRRLFVCSGLCNRKDESAECRCGSFGIEFQVERETEDDEEKVACTVCARVVGACLFLFDLVVVCLA